MQLAREMAEKYDNNLGGKDTCYNRREFAKENLGSMGRECIGLVDMKDFYPGKDHLGMSAVEALCLRIGHVEKKYSRFTKCL